MKQYKQRLTAAAAETAGKHMSVLAASSGNQPVAADALHVDCFVTLLSFVSPLAGTA